MSLFLSFLPWLVLLVCLASISWLLADHIELVNRLQEAGAQVVYGIVGYKVHAKMNQLIEAR